MDFAECMLINCLFCILSFLFFFFKFYAVNMDYSKLKKDRPDF